MIHSFRDERKILEKHIEIEDKLLHLFTENDMDEKKLYEVLDEMNKLRKKKVVINKDILSRREVLDVHVLNMYETCSQEIKNIQEKLNKNEVPTININKIIDFLKIFSNIYVKKELEISNDTENSGKIIVLINNESFPLKFKNGKKILLTSNNFDLSVFTHDELIELLRLLDVIISDNRYDFLRSEIAQQISIISSISLFKDTTL